MALYQLRTFEDLVNAIREEAQIPSTDTVGLSRAKRDLNIVYQELTAEKNWWWLEGTCTIQIPAYIYTGTVAVSSGSADAEFSIAPAQSQRGKHFAVDGFNEIYTVESHAAGSTSAKLTELYAGATSATATYKLWTDRLPLPTDCRETVEVWHEHQANTLEGKGKQEFRKLSNRAPRAEGKPGYYYTGDFVDPSLTSAITSLPAVTSRASAGVVKTLTFATTLPSAFTSAFAEGKPIRIRVSGASSPSYNGDVILSSASGTTVSYTGKAELQESTVADTGVSVTLVDQEADYDRYRELFLYPCLNTSRVSLHVDYVKEVFPLENDDDEPAVPLQDRSVLLYGALHRVWSRMRNPEEAQRNLLLYSNKLAKMAGKHQDSMETPKLSPSKLYLSAKRSNMRRMRGDSISGGDGSGGSSQGVIMGTANRVAVYDTSGILNPDSSISTAELLTLDGASSNIQAQIDDITALGDGKILVGASGVATEVTPTGDVTISNAGVTAISPLVIVDADVSASAALSRAKVATGTVKHIVINHASTGALSSTGITAGQVLMGNATDEPTGTTVTGDVTIGSTGVTAIASGVIVDADINASAAIARSKVASGSNDHVVINGAAGALSSEASLAVVRGGTGLATLTTKNILIGAGTSNVSFLAPSATANTSVVSNGTDFASGPVITSNTYTPTLTGVTNVAASTPYVCQWLRVGNVVTVSGNLDMDGTSASAYILTEIGISLPVASNFSDIHQCCGTAGMYAASTETPSPGIIVADFTNDRATLRVNALTGANIGYFFHFTYLVI